MATDPQTQGFVDGQARLRMEEARKIAVEAVFECIRDLGGVPNGHLYGMLMSSGMTLETYSGILNELIRDGRITSTNHYLQVSK